MASDEIKETIVSYFGESVPTLEKDWKRVSKRKLPSGDFLREYHNAKAGRTVLTIGEDEDAAIIERDVWIYGYGEKGSEPTDEFFMAFEPRDRWRREACQHDQHQEDALRQLFGIPEQIYEALENSFMLQGGMTEAEARAAVEACGIVHDQGYTDFLNGRGRPEPQPPQAPIDPPVPPLAAGTPPQAARGPSKATRAKETRLLPVSDHANVVVEIASSPDMRIWEAEHRHHAHHKVQREVAVHRIERLSPGVYAETTREKVDTDQALYPDAAAFRAKVLEHYGVGGRVARGCVNQGSAKEIDGGVERRMSISGFYHVIFTTREVGGAIVEVRVHDGEVYGIKRNPVETHLFTIGADEIGSLGLKPVDATRPWSQAWPVANLLDPEMDDDPDDYSGGIVFCEFMEGEESLCFMCGYEESDGTIADSMNVPNEAFEDIFPEYDADWNTAEASHDIRPLKGQTLKQLEAVVRERLLSVGCVEIN